MISEFDKDAEDEEEIPEPTAEEASISSSLNLAEVPMGMKQSIQHYEEEEEDEEKIFISKYFSRAVHANVNERRKERGRKSGGEWLDELDKEVTVGNKFIYRTDLDNEDNEEEIAATSSSSGDSDPRRASTCCSRRGPCLQPRSTAVA